MGLEYFGGPRILNGLTGETQTFAVGSSGTDFGIASSGSAHTFSLPDASASARGLVTTGTQTIAGAKTFSTSLSSPTLTLTNDSGSLPGLNFTYSANGGIIQNNGTRAFLFNGGGITVTQSMFIDSNIPLTVNGYLSGASNVLSVRNSTSAQTFRVYNTYTSSTNYERLNLRGVAAANFEIGPENGSGGGTLRGLTIGGYTAGSSTITPWLTFDNAGNSTACTGSVVRLGAYNYLQASAGIYIGSGFDYPKLGVVSDPKTSGNVTFAQPLWINLANGYPGTNTSSLWPGGSMNVLLGAGGYAASGTQNGGAGGRFNILLAAGAAGVGGGSKGADSSVRIKAASGQSTDTFEVVSSSDVLMCSISATGQIIETPPASVTLSTNGQFSVEMTSNTAGNLVYRGSDGTTRRCALVFV